VLSNKILIRAKVRGWVAACCGSNSGGIRGGHLDHEEWKDQGPSFQERAFPHMQQRLALGQHRGGKKFVSQHENILSFSKEKLR
jgi:hypothetical protein